METDESLLASAAPLRARWATPDGLALVACIEQALRRKDPNWSRLLPFERRVDGEVRRDDLRGISFLRADLSDSDLSFSDLSFADFKQCNLRAATLQNSVLIHADFQGSSLGAADLVQAKADHSVFLDADLSAAMLLSGSFRHADFRFANLRSAILDRCDLSHADFRGADMRHVEMRKAIVDGLVESRRDQASLQVDEPGVTVQSRTEALLESMEAVSFETSVLALNAAMEASRAGEGGRAIATLAGEVRLLAQRNADSVRELRQVLSRRPFASRQRPIPVVTTSSFQNEVVVAVSRMQTVIHEIDTMFGRVTQFLPGTPIGTQVAIAVKGAAEADSGRKDLVAATRSASGALQSMAQELDASLKALGIDYDAL